MADYKSMYYHLLRAQLKAIGILQNAHVDTEELFMDSKDPVEFADSQIQQQNDTNE